MSTYNFLAGCYDRLTYDVDYTAWADYIEAHFRKHPLPGRTVLDLACGTGTLTCLLGERGYEMIGVDASADMLMIAAEKAGETPMGVPPLFLNQRMEELDLYGTVDAAICSLDGVNYAKPENLAEIFRRLWLFLEPGGVLVFDINSPEKLRNLDGEMFADEQEDVFCVWRAALSEKGDACIYGMDIFSRCGDLWQRDTEEHIEYIYAPDRLKMLLSAAKFEDVQIYGNLRTAPPEKGEDRIFFTARKPKA